MAAAFEQEFEEWKRKFADGINIQPRVKEPETFSSRRDFEKELQTFTQKYAQLAPRSSVGLLTPTTLVVPERSQHTNDALSPRSPQSESFDADVEIDGADSEASSKDSTPSEGGLSPPRDASAKSTSKAIRSMSLESPHGSKISSQRHVGRLSVSAMTPGLGGASAAGGQVCLKTYFGSEIRRVYVPRQYDYSLLVQKVEQEYGPDLSVGYKDEDQDLITIRSQGDLDAAMAHVGASNILRLYLSSKSINKSKSPSNGSSNDSTGSPTHTHTHPPLNPLQSHPIRWQRANLIGEGAHGKVYLAMNVDNGQLLAVKSINLRVTNEGQQKEIESLKQEISLLQTFQHENIVRYVGVQRSPKYLHIFMEYVPGGSITNLLRKFGPFKESVIKVYTKQLLLGLDYLHENRILHRDIKGANALVDSQGCVKLADFGCSKHIADIVSISDACKSIRGTPLWMAPEIISQSGHGPQADVWSIGCTVLEMLTAKPPWAQFSNPYTALFSIVQAKTTPPLPENISTDVRDFLNCCLQCNPRDRSTVKQLLEHPFITKPFIHTDPPPITDHDNSSSDDDDHS
eukprot:GILK01006712.1.p1 GENE.GILK01006712.1~~GILK01006712.1.p1  ORF type:complete len:572 (-),score=95.99 GILK01006712.1:175-1890(-)